MSPTVKKYLMVDDLKNDVLNYLSAHSRGRGNAVKAWILAAALGTSLRSVNEAVRELRQDGRLIGSAKEPPYGYFIPIDEVEVRTYLHSFRGELFDMLKTYNRQRRAQREHIAQAQVGELFPVTR